MRRRTGPSTPSRGRALHSHGRMLRLLALLAFAWLALLLSRAPSLRPPQQMAAISSSSAEPLPNVPSASPSPPSADPLQPPDDYAAVACRRASQIGSDGGCMPRRLVFVGGLQRSGTSTLASLLAKLPCKLVHCASCRASFCRKITKIC